MTTPAQTKQTVATLILKSLSGDATTAELRDLNRMVSGDRELIPFVVDVLGLESAISWTIAKHHQGGVRKDLVAAIVDSLEEDCSPPQRGAARRPGNTTAQEAHHASAANELTTNRMFALAASILLAAGCLLGSAATWYFASQRPAVLLAGAEPGEKQPAVTPAYEARVVNATSCRWSSGAKFPVENNGALRQGESLQLVEGIAQIHLEWAEGLANLRIEGPAGLVLTADHGCSLSHGRLTADVVTNTSTARFSIDTPNGLVEMADDSSTGVFVNGRDVSVHSFRGADTSLRPWSADSNKPNTIFLNEGDSITLVERADGNMDVERGKCRAAFFASQMSMYSDALDVSSEYVQDVRSLGPLLYWRFEEPLDETSVQNEMSDRLGGKLFGSIQRRERSGNRFVEFGASSLIDSTLPRIEANEPFVDEVQDKYTLEMWIKPNHYHLGTIVSFVAPEPIRGDTGLIESAHGLLLEIGGPRTTQTSIEQPGKVRFLHRSPPGGRLKGATCFSSQSYEPRKWQHLVVVKDGEAMRIYLNGVLTGEGQDSTPLADDLKMLVGQLDQWRGARMYVGQLDELAFYPIALTPDQIQKHFELVRSTQAVSPDATAPKPQRKTNAI